MLILVVAMVTRSEFLMLFLMLLQDHIFFYLLTIKKLFASLSFIAKQYKTQKSNKVCQDFKLITQVLKSLCTSNYT